MGERPELIECLCLGCGKEWDGFFPSGRAEDKMIECPSCGKIEGVVNSVEKRHAQLLMAVENKIPGLSRHQVALKIIRNAFGFDGAIGEQEKMPNIPIRIKKPAPGGEEDKNEK